MRACIVTCGTNGDLRPFLAIASALVRAGHSVHVMHSQGASLSALCAAASAQLPSRNLSASELVGPDVEASLRGHRSEGGNSSSESWVLPSNVPDFKTTAAALYSFFYSSIGEAARQVLEQCMRNQANIIVASSLALPFAHAAAEALSIPIALVDLQMNWLPTHEAAVAGSNFPRTLSNWRQLNWRSFHVALQVSLSALEPHVKVARTALHLDYIPMDKYFSMITNLPYLMAWDPWLYPHPVDYPKLYPRTYPCGYLPLHVQSSQLPVEAMEFIHSSNDRVVFISWGSMAFDSLKMTRLAIGALKHSGCRGILQAGWAGLALQNLRDEDDPRDQQLLSYARDNVYELFESVNHSALFPLMGCIVHHGGAGTIQTGFEAGVPQVATFLNFDQPANGRRLVQVGVSPQTYSLRSVSVQQLGDAIIQATTNPSFRQQAIKIKESMVGSEDATARALKALEETKIKYARLSNRAPSRLWQEIQALRQ